MYFLATREETYSILTITINKDRFYATQNVSPPLFGNSDNNEPMYDLKNNFR